MRTRHAETAYKERFNGAIKASKRVIGPIVEKVKYRCNRPEYTPGRSIPGYIMA